VNLLDVVENFSGVVMGDLSSALTNISSTIFMRAEEKKSHA
jgi:hypothetical protein